MNTINAMFNKKFILTFLQYTAGVFLFLIALTLLLSHFGYIKSFKPYVVQSGSMEPSIKTGSIVLSLPSPLNSYQQGDIITFAHPTGDTASHPSPKAKNLVTHRIEAKLYPDGVSGDPVYLTAGDANEDFDTWEVRNENIVGKVVLNLPYLGFLVDFAQKPQGFILLVIIPATIVVYEELKNLLREIRNQLKKTISTLQGPTFKGQKTTENQDNHPTGDIASHPSYPLPKVFVLVPILGVCVFLVAFSAGYFFDLEKSLANILGAASSYGEKVSNIYLSGPYTCPGGATVLDQQFGTAIIKIVGSVVKVDVILKGATPSSTYDIWVNQDPGGCPLSIPTAPGALTTDASGNGTVHVETALVPGATNFWISAVGGGQVLRSIAVSF